MRLVHPSHFFFIIKRRPWLEANTSRLSAVDVTMTYLVPMPRGLICFHRWTLELLSLMKLSLAKADGVPKTNLPTTAFKGNTRVGRFAGSGAF